MLCAASSVGRQAKSQSAKACEERTEKVHIRDSLFGWRRSGRVVSKNGLMDRGWLTLRLLSETQDWQDQQEVSEIIGSQNLRQDFESESRGLLNCH